MFKNVKILLKESYSKLFQLGLKENIGLRCSNFYFREPKKIIYSIYLGQLKGFIEPPRLQMEPLMLIYIYIYDVGHTKIENLVDNNLYDFFSSFVSNKLIFINSYFIYSNT